MGITVENIIAFMSVLSWKKIAQFFIFVAIVGTAYITWDNKSYVYSLLKIGIRADADNTLTIKLSPSIIAHIDTTVEKTKYIIGGIQIVSVDFRKNTRGNIYFSFSDLVLKSSAENYSRTMITDVPLFTDSELVNQKIIELINGEFVCYKFKDTIAYNIFPKAADTITTVCAVSIPPYYGRFSGYMNIYLTHEPTSDDLVFLKQLSREISLKIYTIDINKTIKYKAF